MSKPPALACWIMACLAEARYRDDLLADLEDEFGRLSDRSPGVAWRWYWAQVIRAAPGMIGRRLEMAGLGRSLIVGSGYILGVGIVLAWDILVARSATAAIHGSYPDMQLEYLRLIYFAFAALGGLLAGVTVAALTFTDMRSPLSNVMISLSPMILLELGIGLSRLAVTEQLERIPYISLRSVVLAMMIVVGGTLVLRYRNRSI